MKQKDIQAPADYYRNPSGLPTIKRFGSGQFGDTQLVVQDVVNYTHTMSGASERFTITHGLGRRVDIYGTYTIDGELRMLPDQEYIDALPTIGGVYIADITDRDVTIYAEFTSAKTLKFRLLLLDYDYDRQLESK